MATNSPGKSTYWIIIGIVIILVLVGGYKVYHHFQKSNTAMNVTPTPTTQTQSGQPTQPVGTNNVTTSDTSTQQLDKDLQNIQNNLNQLNQDQNSASQSLNSQSADIPSNQ